jgi:hypothetical protein
VTARMGIQREHIRRSLGFWDIREGVTLRRRVTSRSSRCSCKAFKLQLEPPQRLKTSNRKGSNYGRLERLGFKLKFARLPSHWPSGRLFLQLNSSSMTHPNPFRFLDSSSQRRSRGPERSSGYRPTISVPPAEKCHRSSVTETENATSSEDAQRDGNKTIHIHPNTSSLLVPVPDAVLYPEGPQSSRRESCLIVILRECPSPP